MRIKPPGLTALGRTRRWALAALVATSVLALAPAAQADSIVYAKAGNVWLAHPDGSGQYQVTTDGTTDLPYYAPTQADDGTIVALHRVADGSLRPSLLVRMHQNGSPLNAPFRTSSPLGNVGEAAVSPNGSAVGYTFVVPGHVSWTDLDGSVFTYSDTAALTDFTTPDHLAGAGYDVGGGTYRNLSWVGPTRALLINRETTRVDYVDTGTSSAVPWFDFCDVAPGQIACDADHRTLSPVVGAAVTRAGDRLATVNGTTTGSVYDRNYDKRVVLYQGGTPPAAPAPKCVLDAAKNVDPAADDLVHLSWSPGGTALAYDDADGVHVAQVPSLADCGAVTNALVLPGASSPSWGPADVNPGPREGGGGGTGGGPGGGPAPGPGPSPVATVVPAPTVTLTVSRRLRLRTIARKRSLPVTCRIRGAGRCRVAITIKARDARHLKLHLKRHAKTYTLGTRSHTFKKAGRATLNVRLSRKTARALRGARRLRVTITATSTAAGHTKRTKTIHTTLKR